MTSRTNIPSAGSEIRDFVYFFGEFLFGGGREKVSNLPVFRRFYTSGRVD
jgi:hypothetical protein